MTTAARRAKALEQAAGSLRLEGLSFSSKSIDLRQAWLDGSITGDQLLAATKARHMKSRTAPVAEPRKSARCRVSDKGPPRNRLGITDWAGFK